ncbi:hypothetical protein HMPREF9947_2236 [Propionibacterium sp. 409-HC1]|nr:hypothetical protein HMPREF9947_2236 [Propionibacterium sp. 409-HC1]
MDAFETLVRLSTRGFGAMRCCGRCMARTISKRASWLSHFLGQYWGLLVSPSNVASVLL